MKERVVLLVLGLKSVHSTQHEKPFSVKREMWGTAAPPFASTWASSKRKGGFFPTTLTRMELILSLPQARRFAGPEH